MPVSGLPLQPLTNRGSQGAINPAAVLVPGDVPGPLEDTGCARWRQRTRKPPFLVRAPALHSQKLSPQLPWHPWKSAFCKGLCPPPALQLSLTHTPICFLTSPFPLFFPFFYLFQYKLQSYVKFILIKHCCLSLWVSRKLQSNAKDTLITTFNGKKELVDYVVKAPEIKLQPVTTNARGSCWLHGLIRQMGAEAVFGFTRICIAQA